MAAAGSSPPAPRAVACLKLGSQVAAKLDKSLLSPLPIFRGVSDDGLELVVRLGTDPPLLFRRYRIPAGWPADRFFVLLDGRLRVTRINADGQQTIVRMVNPGDLFGIAQALRRNDYPGTATAVMDSTALVGQ